MMSLLILGFAALGCGALLPAPGGRAEDAIGLRFFGGTAVIALILFFGNPVLGIGLKGVAFTVLAVAVAGIIRLVRDVAGGGYGRSALLHPVPVLFALVGGVVLVGDDVTYIPWQWDEYARWSALPKLMFLSGTYYLPEFRIGNLGYTPGWSLLMAFPTLVRDHFSIGHAALVPFVMHLGVLGILFDLVRRAFAGVAEMGAVASRLAAWSVLMVLLLMEVSWKLVPFFLASEKPQIFTLTACLTTSLLCSLAPPGRLAQERVALAGYFGLFLALGYLFKVSMLALAPSVLVFAVVLLLGDRKPGHVKWHIGAVAALALPLLAIYAAWAGIKPQSTCYGAPVSLFRAELLQLILSDRGADLATRFGAEMGAYMGRFKLALTLAGGAGVLIALGFRRTTTTAAMLIIYVGVYVTALYYFHLVCFGEHYFQELNSIPRFTRIWLRLVHIFGPVMLVVIGAGWLAKRRLPATLARSVRISLGVFIVGALAWQVVQATRSLDNMATRSPYADDRAGSHHRFVFEVAREAGALKAVLKQAGLHDPRVLMIAQGTDGMPRNIANYHAVTDKPGGGFYDYSLDAQFSWGEQPNHWLMRKTNAAAMTAMLRTHPVIWPYLLDGWMRGLLAPLIRDPDCRKSPERYFLLRGKAPDAPYDCIAK